MSIEQLITEHLDIWTAADTEKKSGRGRGSANSGNVYGIKKLRELILELAVRGKLVPQDPNDEPASELLKRIQAEKAKLIAEGKIKKSKPLAEITDDEKLFELPVGWEWVRLGNTGKIFNGNSINENEKTEKYTNLKSGYPFIATKDVGYGRDKLDYQNGVLIPFDNESFKIAHKGAILICSEGGSSGKKIGITEMDICFGNKLYANETWLGFVSRFLFYIYQSPYFFTSFSERMTGIIGGISINQFLTIPIPIPSASEQHRIVAKVDELMALCDQLENQHNNAAEAHEKLVAYLLGTLTQSQNAEDFNANWQRIVEHFDTLFTTETSIDELKQTLLQLAVMGKLVPQDPHDEPASELLKRIQAEKAKLIAEGKIKKTKPMAQITNEEKLFILPKEWDWVRLEYLMPEFQNGASSRGDSDGDPIIVLRLADIKDRHISLDEPRELFISPSMIEKYRLSLGDILVVRVNGSADLVGGFVVCEQSFDGIYCDHFIRMRIPQNTLIPRFLSLVGASQLVRNRIQELFITTAGQKTVNQNHISSLIIPLLSVTEQHRIVAKVDELMAICDQLKTRINEANELQRKIADVMTQVADC